MDETVEAALAAASAASAAPLDFEAHWPYFESLVDKYLPRGPLRW